MYVAYHGMVYQYRISRISISIEQNLHNSVTFNMSELSILWDVWHLEYSSGDFITVLPPKYSATGILSCCDTKHSWKSIFTMNTFCRQFEDLNNCKFPKVKETLHFCAIDKATFLQLNDKVITCYVTVNIHRSAVVDWQIRAEFNSYIH